MLLKYVDTDVVSNSLFCIFDTIIKYKIMAAPKFQIRTKSHHATVYYNISISRKDRLTGKTDVSVDSRYWKPRKIQDKNGKPIDIYIDSDKALSLGKKKDADQNQIRLNNFYDWAKDEVGKVKDLPSPKDLLRAAINDYYNRNDLSVKVGRKESFLDAFDLHMKYIQSKKTLSKDTLGHYSYLKKLLIDFSKDEKIPLLYENFSLVFLDKFKKYLREPKKRNGAYDSKPKAYSQGYINLMTQKLISVLGYSKDMGYHDNSQYKLFTQKKVEPFAIYLPEKDVIAIRDAQLDNTKDEAVRDYFILLCRTGARVGDAMEWTNDNIKTIDGEKVILYRHSKTNKLHKIPITAEIETILNRWNNFNPNGGFPNEKRNTNITDKTINTRIKKIARDIGLTNKIEGFKNNIKTTLPKCDWIFTHTGKRTAATLAYLSGMPIYEIRGTITMHSNDITTIGYIKSDDDLEILMKKRGDVV